MANEVVNQLPHPKNQAELQTWLETVTGKSGDQVMFNPPSLDKIKKPCWIYRLADMSQTNADNKIYKTSTCYEITFITKDPSSKWISIMAAWAHCRFVRSFQADGFHHYVFRFWTLL